MKLPKESGERIAQAIARARADVPKGMDAGQAALAVGLAAMAKEVLAAVDAELSGLRDRLKDAERKGLRYSGTWQRALEYKQGDVVTHDGSAWVCLVPETKGKPGDGLAWQLFVKRGRDAK